MVNLSWRLLDGVRREEDWAGTEMLLDLVVDDEEEDMVDVSL